MTNRPSIKPATRRATMAAPGVNLLELAETSQRIVVQLLLLRDIRNIAGFRFGRFGLGRSPGGASRCLVAGVRDNLRGRRWFLGLLFDRGRGRRWRHGRGWCNRQGG